MTQQIVMNCTTDLTTVFPLLKILDCLIEVWMTVGMFA